MHLVPIFKSERQEFFSGMLGMKNKSPKQGATSIGATVIALPADFRMASLDPVKAELAGAVASGEARLDGAMVERVDTAALQLLVVYQRERRLQGEPSVWSGASDSLRDAAGVLGLTNELNLPAIVAA